MVNRVFLKKKKKKSKLGGLRIYFSGIPLEFLDLSLYPLPEKTIFHPSKFCKIAWHPLRTPKSKIKTHGNSTWAFLEHSWKFNLLFNWPLKFPRALSSIPVEIPYCQSPLFGFFWDRQMLLSGQVPHTIGAIEGTCLVESWTLCASLNAALKEQNNLQPITDNWMDFFRKLTSMQDAGYILHLQVAQQLPSL